MAGRGRAAARLDLQPAQLGRDPVGVGAALGLAEPAAQPVGRDALQLIGGHRRHVQDDLAVLVESAGAVVLHLAVGPAPGQGALPDLPLERGGCRVHAGAAGRLAADHQGQDVVAVVALQGEVEGVAGGELGREEGDAPARQAHLAQVVGDPGGAAGAGAGEGPGHRWRAQGQVALAGKDDRRASLGAHRGHLGVGGDEQVVGLRRREVEGDRGLGGAGRLQAHAEQGEELEVELLRHLVDAVDQHLGHPGEELDQRHARVADVMVGPLRAVLRDHALGLIHEILEAAIIKVDRRQRHGYSSPGMR